MKKLLLILWLLLPLVGFSQAVPNTETFSLQDVYNAVDNHTPATTTDLQSCFANAISGYFNPTYNQDSYAPANSMLRFRDYKPSCTPSILTLSSPISIGSTTLTLYGNAVTSCNAINMNSIEISYNSDFSYPQAVVDSGSTSLGQYSVSVSGRVGFTDVYITASTTYYYRAIMNVSGGIGNVYGATLSVTTTP